MSKDKEIVSSFRKRTFIEVYCAKCGARYDDDNEEYFMCFTDKDEAVEVITDFWTVKGNKAFCEGCS